MNLTDYRVAVQDALAVIPEVVAGDWVVLDGPYDSIQPPAFLCVWGPEPWREPWTACTDLVSLQVVAVAARLTPEATYPVLETMVDAAYGALVAAKLRPAHGTAPGPFESAQITYLAARIHIARPVDT